MGYEFTKENRSDKKVTAGNTIVQKKSVNNTGLPDSLKSGAESLSGFSMNDVRVHYNSPKPSQMQAYAYTQGTDIHVAPGQEENLAHEAWHVAQQKQGRVAPTMQMKGIAVNDDSALEQEADVMGGKILQAKMQEGAALPAGQASNGIVQMASDYTGIMPSHAVTLDKLKEKNTEGDQTFGRMDLTYHHIIPEDILKEVFTQSLQPVYNYCLKNKAADGADELIKSVDELIVSGKKLRDPDKAAQNKEFTFSDSIQGKTKKDKKARNKRRGALDGDFGAAIRWIPGNIHQGPSKRTKMETTTEIHDKEQLEELYKDGGDFDEEFIKDNPDALTGDGGAGFEYAAVNVVGKERIKLLAQLLTDMFKLPHFAEAAKPKKGDNIEDVNTYPGIKEAIADVKKIINTVNSLFYDQTAKPKKAKHGKKARKPLLIPTMDLDKWEKPEGVDANQAIWKVKDAREKGLKVQIEEGETGYQGVEEMFTAMSSLAVEMNKHAFLKNKKKITQMIIDNNEVKDLAVFMEKVAGDLGKATMSDDLKSLHDTNQESYIKLLQSFKDASRKFLTQFEDSKKKSKNKVMVKSSYDKLCTEYQGFLGYFG